MTVQSTVPVFFTIDNAYAPYLAAALKSAVHNADPARQYRAIVLYRDLTDENIRRLASLAAPHFAVEFHEMSSVADSITDTMSNRLRCDYFTLAIYFRLFIPDMFPQYDRGIYIDSDVIVTGDLAELYDTDIGDHLIGACRDLSISHVPELMRYTREAVGMDDGDYINSGVLLLNLKAMREKQFSRHFLSLLNTYAFDTIAPDQDYLNAICNRKIYYLGAEWDAMPNDSAPAMPSPKLIHYNLFSKPWCYDGVQYGDYFWEYAKDSGFLDEVKAYKENYSAKQKASDAACMQRIIERGSAICENEVTFRKLYESGVKIRL